MSQLSLTPQSDNVMLLSGDLTFATIDKKTAQLIDFTKISLPLVIDFAQVRNSDSAGLALLIEWLKMSQTGQAQLHFKNIPAQLLTLAQLSGFDLSPYFA